MVTHVLGCGSLARPPMRRSSLSDVHTRSHTKLGSLPASSPLRRARVVLSRLRRRPTLVGQAAGGAGHPPGGLPLVQPVRLAA